jgi:hypothetical protein
MDKAEILGIMEHFIDGKDIFIQRDFIKFYN